MDLDNINDIELLKQLAKSNRVKMKREFLCNRWNRFYL